VKAEEIRLAVDRGEIPDVHDGDVRAMVLRDHGPEETWVQPFSGGPEAVFVKCSRCAADWPCPSITAAREVEHSGEGEARS
jgi:hypothetical protein